MKKCLLTFAALVIVSIASMAQFIQTATSVTYTGHEVPTGTPSFYSYQAYPTTKYSENTCTSLFTGTLGGFDANQYDATTVSPARADGVIFYGGGIANVYSGTPCVSNMPSFGFNINLVDLSLPANQKISFKYQSDVNLSLAFQIKDAYYNNMLSSLPFTLIGDGLVHTISLDFSSYVITGAVLTAIKQVALTYTSTTLSPNFAVSVANITLGSSVTTAVTDSQGSLTGANVFPNPTNGLTTVTADFAYTSDVKVSLLDMYGRELNVIAEGNYSSINTNFDVSNLSNGIYTVYYQVNGKVAKVQKLIIQ